MRVQVKKKKTPVGRMTVCSKRTKVGVYVKLSVLSCYLDDLFAICMRSIVCVHAQITSTVLNRITRRKEQQRRQQQEPQEQDTQADEDGHHPCGSRVIQPRKQ